MIVNQKGIETQAGGFLSFAAKFFLNDYRGICRKHGVGIELIPPDVLAALVRAVYDGRTTRARARCVLNFAAACYADTIRMART